MTSLIIEARVTSYDVFKYISQKTTFSVHWSASRVINLIIQPCLMSSKHSSGLCSLHSVQLSFQYKAVKILVKLVCLIKYTLNVVFLETPHYVCMNPTLCMYERKKIQFKFSYKVSQCLYSAILNKCLNLSLSRYINIILCIVAQTIYFIQKYRVVYKN